MSFIINPYNVKGEVLKLLNAYSGAELGYSMRLLDKNYTGKCIRVRRSNDNAESDIGFTSTGNLDESALTTFTGANSGYVTTWYDQSGNARNATQTTRASQPQIVNGGTVHKLNNKPAMFFDGSDDYFSVDSAVTTNFSGEDKPLSLFDVWSTSQTGTRTVSLHFSRVGATDPYWHPHRTAATSVINFVKRDNAGTLVSIASTDTYSTNTQYIMSSISPGTSTTIFLNGNASAILSDSMNIGTVTFDQALYGAARLAAFDPAVFAEGYRQETVLYASDKSSDRTGIRDNINTYFGVY